MSWPSGCASLPRCSILVREIYAGTPFVLPAWPAAPAARFGLAAHSERQRLLAGSLERRDCAEAEVSVLVFAQRSRMGLGLERRGCSPEARKDGWRELLAWCGRFSWSVWLVCAAGRMGELCSWGWFG